MWRKMSAYFAKTDTEKHALTFAQKERFCSAFMKGLSKTRLFRLQLLYRVVLQSKFTS